MSDACHRGCAFANHFANQWSYFTYYMLINHSLDNSHSSVNVWYFVSFLNPLPWINKEFQSTYFKENVMLIGGA